MTALSVRERRLVAVALLFAALAALLYGLILPLSDGFAARAAARQAALDRYARDELAVVQIASTRRAAEAQQRDAAAFRLPGASAADATEALKARIAGAVTTNGGSLASIEDVAAAKGLIRVRAAASLTTTQLAQVLQTIGRQQPVLIIEALTVAADAAAVAGTAGPVDVRLEVSGSFPAPR